MFLAEVVSVHVDEKYLDEKNRFALEKTELISYVHGEYYSLGKLLGNFGYSIRKPEKQKKIKKRQGK